MDGREKDQQDKLDKAYRHKLMQFEITTECQKIALDKFKEFVDGKIRYLDYREAREKAWKEAERKIQDGIKAIYGNGAFDTFEAVKFLEM